MCVDNGVCVIGKKQLTANKKNTLKKPIESIQNMNLKTPFLIILLFIVILNFGIYWRTFEFSRANSIIQKNVPLPGLEKGWFLQRPIDLSDRQWKGFRSQFPLIIIGIILFTLLSTFFKKIKIIPITLFYNAIAMFILYFCFKSSILFPISISILNFIISFYIRPGRNNKRSLGRLVFKKPLINFFCHKWHKWM